MERYRLLILDTKIQFNESYILEVPINIGQFPIGNQVIDNIQARIQIGQSPVNLDDLNPGLRKIGNGNIIYYWIQDTNNLIQLAVELEKTAYCLIVKIISKTSERGQPPYASELYPLILHDQRSQNTQAEIRLSSDNMLSDDGFAIWKKMFDDGLKILVYDATDPSKTFIHITSSKELEKYFSKDLASKKWQYLLTESIDQLGDTISRFNRYRLLELAGLLST